MMMTTMVVVVIRIICKPIESKMCVVQGSDPSIHDGALRVTQKLATLVYQRKFVTSTIE